MPILTSDLPPEQTQILYKNDPLRANQLWWMVEDEDLIYQSVFAVVDQVLLNLNIRRRMNYFFSCLYNDIGAAFTASQNVNLYYNRTALDGNAVTNSRITLNVLQNGIDTACALISKNKPKPQFLTDESKDYNTKVRGKKLTKYVEGVFDRTKMYQIMQRVFQDACIYGTGFMKILEEDGEIKAEWVYIEEILVDDLEGMNQTPRQIHQRKYVQRSVLLAQYPDFTDAILSASQISGGAATYSTADLIPVVESWHLPSGPKAKDGKHTICIENSTLFAEEYKKDYFPIIVFRWADQTLGFWGRGCCHETWKLQLELDVLMRLTQQGMRLVGGPIIAVESGSNISEEHITSNRVAKIVEYAVNPPQYLTPPTVQSEVLQHIQFLKSSIYEILGVSESAATGNVPIQLKSGEAVREAADMVSGRFQVVGQRYEDKFLEIAKIIVDMSADMVKDNPDLSVLVDSKGFADRIMFKEAMVEVNEYKLQILAISGLASTPAGRLDQLMEYAQAGYLDRTQVMDIVDFPDLADTTSLETASLHLTQQILSNIKEKGEYIPPGPYLQLDIAYRMACLEVDRAKLQHVPDEYIELLQQWANTCKSMIPQQATPAAPQPQQQPAAPAPVAPPQGQ